MAEKLVLYDAGLATDNAPTSFDQTWSNGLIEIWATPTVVANARRRGHQGKPIQYKASARPATQIRRAK